MPEGPEIQLAADKIAAALQGRVLEDVFFAFDRLKPFEQILLGQPVHRVEARGKALLIRFADGLNIYSHNQLYGKWYIRKRDDIPKTNRQLRLALHNGRHSALLYSASDIDVLGDDELSQHSFLKRIGPNVLDPGVTVAQVSARLRDKTFHRKRLTTLLLDQHFLCGPGNYLRSEILFVANIDPGARPMDLDGKTLTHLARTILKICRRSYETRGITNDPKIVARLKKAKWPRSRHRFFVFDREGEACHLCDSTILKDVIGSRRLYFCPECQYLGK